MVHIHPSSNPCISLQSLTYPCISLHILTDTYRPLQILTDFGVGAWARAIGGVARGGGRAPFWGLSNHLGGCGEQSANMISYGPWATVLHLQAQLC